LTDVFDIVVSFLYGLDFHFYCCCHIWFNPSIFWLKDSCFWDDGCVFGYIFCGGDVGINLRSFVLFKIFNQGVSWGIRTVFHFMPIHSCDFDIANPPTLSVGEH
jgi:hypothetical protein